ncbi:MAG: hypothetical protein WC496_04975 [Phycisphaerae bacterium]|jgi:hypothetical protein
MNRQQKQLVANVVIVVVFTIAMIAGFSNIKNFINRSEAMRAMELLGKDLLQYRKQYGSLPNESYAKQFIEKIGAVRIGIFQYRAPWIEFGAQPDKTILAYAKKNYYGLVKAGYIVLWLDGRVEWMSKKQFEQILMTQQKQQELQWLKEHLQKQINP